MINIRCSSLPLIMQCAAAAQKPEIRVSTTHPQAELGTDVHEDLKGLVETNHIDLGAIANRERRMLAATGKRLWFAHLRELFPSPQCERELSVEVVPGVTVTGHTDIQSGMIGTCRILDWKSGRVDSDYRQQLLGYAALEMLDNHAVDRVETHIVWLREQDVENYTMTSDQLPAWVEAIEHIANWRGGYTSGDHCGYCKRSHECPGYNAVVRRDAAALLDLSVDELEEQMALMAPDRVIELVRQARMLDRVAKSVVSAARNHVTRCGELHGASSKLTIDTTHPRVLDSYEAWPILQEHLDERELAACCKVSLSKVEEFVAKKAPKRGGAAAKRALAKKLEEADALFYGEAHVLKERRT